MFGNCFGVVVVVVLCYVGIKVGFFSVGLEVIVVVFGGNCVNFVVGFFCFYIMVSMMNGGMISFIFNDVSYMGGNFFVGISFFVFIVSGIVGLMVLVWLVLILVEVMFILKLIVWCFLISGGMVGVIVC